MIRNLIQFMKKDVVLTVAWILAIGSSFVVRPSAEYLGYIDFRSLGILWSLMVLMQVFKDNRLFGFIGERLLKKTGKIWQLALVLVLLCFFFSMFITNDVALITFVPFTIMILHKCERRDLMIPIIVLQTIAANLGSMMTPIGNPQNLYLYGNSNMKFLDFIMLMLPYTLIALLLLVLFIFTIKGKGEKVRVDSDMREQLRHPKTMVVFGLLFIEAILVVVRIVPFPVLVLTVLGAALVLCRGELLKVDYALLFTFIGFFIFTGNMGKIDLVQEFLKSIVTGNEILTGIVASQFISNVPAALLLSGFTNNVSRLILAVNFGGLGTLIASMASLISYKLYVTEEGAQKGKYFGYFTVMNIVFLAVIVTSFMGASLIG